MNTDNAIDLVAIALQLGASFVARSFSGDKTQLVPLIAAAIRAQGRILHRRHQPLRRLQQPRRLDQELRLRPRAQRCGEPASTSSPAAIRSRSITRRARCRWSSSTTARRMALRKIDADYDPHDRLGGDDRSCRSTPPRARSSPACSTSIRSRKTCTATSTRWTTPLNHARTRRRCARAPPRSTRSTPACARA